MGYHRRVRVLFILDPLERLELAGDTSYGLMLEAAARGWEVWTCQIGHLGLVGDDAVVDAVPTIVTLGGTPAEAFQIEARAAERLADFDVVMMRKDPPVDVAYLHATWILIEHARGKTLLAATIRAGQARAQRAPRACSGSSHLTPPTIVARWSGADARVRSASGGGTIVVKSRVDGYGGLRAFPGARRRSEHVVDPQETSTDAGHQVNPSRSAIRPRSCPE